jgi:[ribosomal protein S5]-alanine N-acetyltransferase
MQPEFETSRLRLTPASDKDLDNLWRLWTRPEVRKYLFDDTSIGREQARTLLLDAVAVAGRGLGLWTVAERANPNHTIGCVALMPVGTAADYYPPIAGAIEPVIALIPECWGRGYATEALTPMLDYAFRSLRLDRLVGVTDLPNAPSQRLLQRLGFTMSAETDGPRYRLRHYVLSRHPRPLDGEGRSRR